MGLLEGKFAIVTGAASPRALRLCLVRWSLQGRGTGGGRQLLALHGPRQEPVRPFLLASVAGLRAEEHHGFAPLN